MNNQTLLKAKNSLKKRPLLTFLITIILLYTFGNLIFDTIKLSMLGKESKPYTDDFLELLKNENYEELYRKYAIESGINLNDFKKEIEKLHNIFGRIKSYKYAGVSASFGGMPGTYICFYIYYKIKFDSGKSEHDTFGRTFLGYYNPPSTSFSIEIDKEKNRPIRGRMLMFNVSGGFGKKGFSLVLIKP